MTKTGPKLYRAIIDALQADIAAGRFAPGDRLPTERELVERFAVSRLTVREAVIGMEIVGLVEARRGSGVYVTAEAPQRLQSPDLDIGAFELIEARRLIEGECAALAALTRSEADVAALRDTLERMIAENATDSPDEFADRDFHRQIARATANDAMVLTVETLWDVRHRSPLCVAVLDRARKAGEKPRIEDHRAILEAIVAGDAEGARAAMRRHLGRVIGHLLDATETDAMDAAQRRDRANRVAAIG
ncbi:FadR/GntR family transcriptional regulator [Sphingomonas sp. ac-8]|uniref:FadR/GntR family transcriptional regulator n=1 Tax=Sphingomonas sp. ac-8 TaxID=3242977 RepID=UPI003A80DF1C